MGVIENLMLMHDHWGKGPFNAVKGLRLMNTAIQGSDLLPGHVTMDTLESIARSMYTNRKTADDQSVVDLEQASVEQNNPQFLCQKKLEFGALKESSLMDTGLIFSHLLELKQPPVNQPETKEYVFMEVLTACERMRNQLILDESVVIDKQLHKRTPCCKGRPGDGYVGCVLYQIDSLITGSLGIYLAKAELELFRRTGAMPINSEKRVCLLCYSQLLTCRAGLFGARGVGTNAYHDQCMLFRDLVNCSDGFQSKFMILPGQGNEFPQAPFLSFHPRQLSISMRGNSFYVDESTMWFRPDSQGFQ